MTEVVQEINIKDEPLYCSECGKEVATFTWLGRNEFPRLRIIDANLESTRKGYGHWHRKKSGGYEWKVVVLRSKDGSIEIPTKPPWKEAP